MSLPLIARNILQSLPTAAISRAAGVLSDLELPGALQGQVNRVFAELAGINLTESEHPPEHYPSVNAFFTRKLKPGVHEVADGDNVLVCPVDGRLSEFGRIEDGVLVQAKGKKYSLADLLNHDSSLSRFEEASYATLYLSPRDYHRIHSPVAGSVVGMAYVPGQLMPVNRLGVHYVEDLFPKNERLTTFVEMEEERLVAVVKVGATCVGRISVVYDTYVTNRDATRVAFRREYPSGREIESGGELGTFNLGSTVVLVMEGGFTFEPGLKVGDSVRMGMALGHWS